ncbi:MAG TPA: GNAT family N-acetyltransferase [Candidatus Limnocylindria bacterium]|nr:GNAT family N-acetyltransferase [Candidatus Limnocylindria bacterium]
MRADREGAVLSTVSVVLPTLNEVANIVPLIDGLYAAVPALHEVVVVDDDSSDGTGDAVRGYAAAHPDRRVRLEVRTTDHGLTKSIAHGVRTATGEVVVWMDCDLSMPPELVPSLLHGLEEGYDIVVGSRFVSGGSFKRDTAGTEDSALAVALSRLMNYGVQFLLDHRFKDYTSGFIALKRAIVVDLGLRGDYGEYFIDLLFRALRAGYLVLEIPYVCLPRLHGTSKTGTNLGQYLRRGRGYLSTAFGLRIAALAGRDRAVRVTPAAQPAGVSTDFEIRPMTAADIPFVAGLHHRLLFDTLNSRLGIHFLSRLYAGVLADPASRCWVGLSQGRHVAFLSATLDLHRSQGRVTAGVPLRERLIAGVHVLANPHDLRSFLAHQALLIYTRVRFGRPYPTILTLGISQSMWGTGFAHRLADEAVGGFVAQGVRRFYVDTTSENLRAAAFYQKEGFIAVGSIAGNLIFRREIP